MNIMGDRVTGWQGTSESAKTDLPTFWRVLQISSPPSLCQRLLVTGYWLLKCSRRRRKVPVALNTHIHIFEDCCTAMAITDTIFHSPEKAVRSKHPQPKINNSRTRVTSLAHQPFQIYSQIHAWWFAGEPVSVFIFDFLHCVKRGI